MQLATYAFYSAATSTVAVAALAPKVFHVGFGVGEPTNGIPTLVAPRLVSAEGQPAGEFVFEAHALAEGPGLPASLIGPGEFKNLVFDTTSIFGEGSVIAVVQPVGDAAGAVHPVVAYENDKTDAAWATNSNKQIIHTERSGLNAFFLCKQTIAGRETSVLSYGNPLADGEAPVGCDYTTIYEN